MNDIKIFEKSEFGQIRVAGTSEEPLFCLVDLCSAIGITNHRNVKNRLDEDDVRLVDTIDNLGRNQQVTFVTESGLYDVILRSDSELAKPFRKWVTSEVLPAIRKTGGYIATTPEMTDIEILSRALLIANNAIEQKNALIEQQKKRIEYQSEEILARKNIIKKQHEEILHSTETTLQLQRKNKKLAEKIAEDASKVDYYNQCAEMADDTLLSFRETAAMLNIPERIFINTLLDADIIYRSKGKLTPYSKYLDKGFFRLVEWVNQANGYYYQTKVTAKGRKYLNDNWERFGNTLAR